MKKNSKKKGQVEWTPQFGGSLHPFYNDKTSLNITNAEGAYSIYTIWFLFLKSDTFYSSIFVSFFFLISYFFFLFDPKLSDYRSFRFSFSFSFRFTLCLYLFWGLFWCWCWCWWREREGGRERESVCVCQEERGTEQVKEEEAVEPCTFKDPCKLGVRRLPFFIVYFFFVLLSKGFSRLLVNAHIAKTIASLSLFVIY